MWMRSKKEHLDFVDGRVRATEDNMENVDG